MFWQTSDRKPEGLSAQQQAALDAPDTCLLTIVTINRNNAVNALRTIRSLDRVRNDPDVECLFIDGASTDNSVELARTFYRPEDIVSEPDSGIYNAMNKGLYKARGKYVWWLNSGDELIGELDFSAFKKALSASHADVYFCRLVVWNLETDKARGVIAATDKYIPCGVFFPHPSSLFRRACAIRQGGYREKFRIVGDRDLYLRMYLAGCSIEISDFVISKFYSGGISGTKSMHYENLRVDYENKVIPYYLYLYRVMRHQIWLWEQYVARKFCGN